MIKCRILLLVVIFSFIEKNDAALPTTFKICPRNLPNMANCIIEAIEILRPQISSGVYGPNIKFNESLNPFKMGDITTNRVFNLKLSDLQVYGLSNFKIDKLRINTEKFKIEIILTIPKIDGKAKYFLKMVLSLLNLQGSGDFHISMENVKTHLKLTGSRYLRNGVEYLKIDGCEVKIKNAKLKVYFDNLFNGQKALERTANDVINQNIEVVTTEINPIIEQVLGDKLLKITNTIFAAASFDEFFPVK